MEQQIRTEVQESLSVSGMLMFKMLAVQRAF